MSELWTEVSKLRTCYPILHFNLTFFSYKSHKICRILYEPRWMTKIQYFPRLYSTRFIMLTFLYGKHKKYQTMTINKWLSTSYQVEWQNRFINKKVAEQKIMQPRKFVFLQVSSQAKKILNFFLENFFIEPISQFFNRPWVSQLKIL